MRLIYLSQAFYDRYGDCPEILKKRTRSYACLTIRIEEMTVAIPFRHHIAHKYAFRTYGDCGLDYTKAVVIADERYIDAGRAQIEQREFNAIKSREAQIIREFSKYLKTYRRAMEHRDESCYSNIIRYSSLQYFEEYILKQKN